MKRGWSPPAYARPCRAAARAVQLSIVQYRKSRNTRAGCPGGTWAAPRQTDRPALPPGGGCAPAKHVVDAVGLAPSHQLVVAETAVGAQDDAYAWPFLADLRDNARDRLDCAVTARDVRAAGGLRQVPTAEHVEREVASLIIAVEEAAFLLAVRGCGVVEIQHDLRGAHALRGKIHQQCIDLRIVAIDLVILLAACRRDVCSGD